MSPRQIILFYIGFIFLLIVITLPLWWDTMSPYIFGFPSFLKQEINAYIEAIKWLWDSIFG
jgi:hypothetical protein